MHDRLDGALGRAQLSPVAELAAYRAVQEALSNTARHANGADVTVEAEVTGCALRVLVRNDPPAGPRTLQPGPVTGCRACVSGSPRSGARSTLAPRPKAGSR
ncbi:MAG: hypothetical protein ACRDS1_06980 [Pseudonocardiaceae bacterium]